nr:MAG TPA: hypothetical protein [Caudoviricetes sp.]
MILNFFHIDVLYLRKQLNLFGGISDEYTIYFNLW